MPTQYAFDHIGRALGQFLSPKSLVIPHIASPGSIAPWGGQDLENWLVHVGHMTRERCSRALLEAVVTARKVIGKRFHGLLCIGDVSQTFHRYISELNAYDVVRLHGRVPSVEAAAAVQAARVLLLVEAEMSFSPFLPSKFANYACSGKTLLAITPGQSATRGYLSRYGGGIAVENAPKAILEALLKLFASNPADRPAGNVNLYRNLFSANAIGLTWSNSLSTLLAKPSGLQEYCQECHYL